MAGAVELLQIRGISLEKLSEYPMMIVLLLLAAGLLAAGVLVWIRRSARLRELSQKPDTYEWTLRAEDVRRNSMLAIIAIAIAFVVVFNLFAFNADKLTVGMDYSSVTQKEEQAPTLKEAVSSTADLSIDERVDAILAAMTLEQKAEQMVQDAYDSGNIGNAAFGSVFSGGGYYEETLETAGRWRARINSYQDSLLKSDTPLPLLYGIDAVHGLGKVRNAVVFPHNIGIGAANDPDLTERMGEIVADEMKLCGIRWAFAPCVGIAGDQRWGRIYECYSSDEATVTALGTAFSKGLLSKGVMPCAKHYICDSMVIYGTGDNEGGGSLDRGSAYVSEEELRSVYLKPYEALIDAGVRTVMVSFSTMNGTKMHGNSYLINDVLKGELGFDGFVVSDYCAAELLGAGDYADNMAMCINAGVDMLMEPYHGCDCVNAIISKVESGDISEERINDAVSRILRVKLEMGIIDDPYMSACEPETDALGCDEYRAVAEKLVEESLVLLKNDGVLPLKSGKKVLVIGDALDDLGVQCGGWTCSWQGQTEAEYNDCITGTSILDGLREVAGEKNIEIITDSSRLKEADVVIIAIGEKPYSEWYGDADDMSITGDMALAGNENAMRMARMSGKPTVALIVAGRQVLLGDNLKDWDAAVMCYLPGTEGRGIANVLTGKSDFSGKLPMPWYKDNDQTKVLFETGYGLTY